MHRVRFFPRERVTFQTALSQEETLKRLAEIAKPKKVTFAKDALQLYSGKVEGERFWLDHVVNSRSFFFTRVVGKAQPQATGTLIEATIGLRWFGKLLSIFLALIMIPSLIGALSEWFSVGESKNLLPASLFCAIFYGWLVIEFNLRSKAFKAAFQKAFDAQMMEPE